VLGARTGRYGDFVDICAALTGRVPLSGLHTDEGRRARIAFVLEERLAARLSDARPGEELYGLVGHVVGHRAGTAVPAIVGLPASTTEDDLKALGAAAASAGAVALCHVVGVTPEAKTLDQACGGEQPRQTMLIAPADLAEAWLELTTASGVAPLAAVSVGTPHFSKDEFARFDLLLDGRAVSVPTYVSTGRDVLADMESSGLVARLRASGVTLVADTCTYITPILDGRRVGAVMTNSAKWAWYAPANLGVEVVYGSLADCIESAVSGRVVRGRPSYLDG
jgi:predicted aconitase